MTDYLDALAEAAALGIPYLFVWFGVFVRISLVAVLAPGLGERFMPSRVRLAAALALSAIVTPGLSVDAAALRSPAEVDAALLIATALSEAAAGFVIGFALRIMIFGLQIAGAIVAQHLSLSQIFGASVSFNAESPFGSILTFAGVCLVVIAGGHFHLAGALLTTYDALPFGLFPGFAEGGGWSAGRVASAFTMALGLSAPFVIVGLIYSLALAAASRAMPQLSAAFVGAPAITFAGLLLFAVTAPIMLLEWLDAYGRVAVDPLGPAP